MSIYHSSILVLLFFATLNSCKEHDDLPEIYKKYDVTGSFLLYDLNKDRFKSVNIERTKAEFLPASTFKIVNSLIALEENIIPDENFVIKWDGKKRKYDFWNKDHNLKSAFRFSVVWYYQILARKTGKERMKRYLSQMQYGNGELSGPINEFWLKGKFRVTQEQQIELLRKLYKHELPFSKQTMDIVKLIMIYEKNTNQTTYAKTGMTYQDGKAIGWWIGFIEKDGNVYFFANNIEKNEPDGAFIKARIDIAKEILFRMHVL